MTTTKQSEFPFVHCGDWLHDYISLHCNKDFRRKVSRTQCGCGAKQIKAHHVLQQVAFKVILLSFLTTSAISRIPFLDEANSLLGRMESRTFWRGRVAFGASMSPIVTEDEDSSPPPTERQDAQEKRLLRGNY